MSQSNSNEDSVLSEVRKFAELVKTAGSLTTDMSPLVECTASLPLSKFDYWERLIRCEFASSLRPSPPSKWSFRKKPSRLPTWIDLSSGNGFERERTLRSLTGRAAPNSFFFVLAIRRLNDWVPEVRNAARQTIPDIAKQSNPNHVAEALCAVLPHWSSWQRHEESDRNVFFEVLAISAVAHALKNRIVSKSIWGQAFHLSFWLFSNALTARLTVEILLPKCTPIFSKV